MLEVSFFPKLAKEVSKVESLFLIANRVVVLSMTSATSSVFPLSCEFYLVIALLVPLWILSGWRVQQLAAKQWILSGWQVQQLAAKQWILSGWRVQQLAAKQWILSGW